MEYIMPNYYKEFSCVGGACPDTCCAGWQIVIDEHSRKKYKKQKGAFGNRLKNEIDWKNSCFLQYEKGRCAFLNEENLCDIYKEIGKDKLCRTCRVYPRHIEEFEGVREISLSMSCPIVAKMILAKRDFVNFILTAREGIEEEYEEFDYLLFTQLTNTREIMIEMIQNRQIPMRRRIAGILGLAHDIQRRIRNQEYFSIDQQALKYQKHIDALMEKKEKKYFGHEKEQFEFVKNIIGLLQKMEIRSKDWENWLLKVKRKLSAMNVNDYIQGKRAFYKVHKEKKEQLSRWEEIEEQILVYYIFTYYCGAVYDENPYGKIKMATISLYAIEEMLFLEWLSSCQIMELDDWIGYAYQYSRELEHSDLNLEKIEKMLIEEEAYSLKNFMYYIFS